MTGLAPEVAVLPIALGLALALVCHLTTNLSPGGMITPGWLALVLIVEPALALGIAAVVLPTYALGRALQAGISLYGKRLFATVVLIGVLLQMTVALSWLKDSPVFFDYTTIGFIVPGLVAYQLLRQPRMATIAATAAVTAATYSLVLAGIVSGMIPIDRHTVFGGIGTEPSDPLGSVQHALSVAPEVSVVAVTLGLVLALVCHVVANLSPGGIISPGWLALVLLVEPRLALVGAIAVVLTYALGWALQDVVFLYGKRLFATVVLIGVALQNTLFLTTAAPLFFDYTTIGFIVPGLVAYQLLRQPRMATIAATAAVTTATYSVMLTVILLGLFPTEPDAEIADTWASISSTELALSAAGAAVVLALAGIQARRLRRSSMPASILERS